MFLNFFRKNKIPLTDYQGKTIYVKPENKDKYILTRYHGWVKKDKLYVRLGQKHVIGKDGYGKFVRYIDRRKGMQIYLDDKESKRKRDEQWESFGRDFCMKQDPEYWINFEKEHGRYWYRDN